MRSERPAIKVRSRRSNWAGCHSPGQHATRGFSSSTKVSRHLTFVSNTACWLPEAWTGSYACGTRTFLGKKTEFRRISVELLVLIMHGVLFRSPFSRKPTGILKGHSAPINYLSISSDPSQIFSVSTDGTVKVIHNSSLCLTCNFFFFLWITNHFATYGWMADGLACHSQTYISLCEWIHFAYGPGIESIHNVACKTKAIISSCSHVSQVVISHHMLPSSDWLGAEAVLSMSFGTAPWGAKAPE